MAPHAESPTTHSAGSANGFTSNGHSATTPTISVDSPNVTQTENVINSKYTYRTTSVTQDASGNYSVTPAEKAYEFKTERKVPRTGVLLAGLGGNNGTTFTAGIMANSRKLSWATKDGTQSANYYGSLVMGSTIKLGTDTKTGLDVNVPFKDLLPMTNPDDLVVNGWDISSLNLAEAMDRARVLEPGMKEQVRKEMAAMKPMKGIFYPAFVATNQKERADNVLQGEKACWDHVEQIRADIRNFKANNNLDKVIVLWTASTERYALHLNGMNDTADNLMASIKSGHDEISPSTVYAVASVLEHAPYINGSPSNTFVPGLIELAIRENTYIGGDDFKSGQTKVKSAMVDFLISAGIKLTSIASYNHLGNNDGRNLSEQAQFRSKEISKASVVDDMVHANHVLYDHKKGEKPDHCVVIKYMPAVGDNKRALDEYHGEIFCGGHQTISMFNICEDSLLATPLMIDLVLITELFTRVQWKAGHGEGQFQNFHSILSVLSFMLKAPLTPPGTPVINALAKQRSALVNIMRACLGLEPENDMTLEHKLIVA